MTVMSVPVSLKQVVWPVDDTPVVLLHFFVEVCLVCNTGLIFVAYNDLESLSVFMLMILKFLFLILYLSPH